MATDTLTIVADTLRTMMGATAAEPYIRAIEKAGKAAHGSAPPPPTDEPPIAHGIK